MTAFSQFACPVCQDGLRMVKISEARREFGLSSRTIRNWLLTGRVHAVRTLSDELMICRSSLFAAAVVARRQPWSTNAEVYAKRLVDSIEQHYSDADLSLTKIAHDCGRSVWYSDRLLLKYTGVGFRAHARRIRCSHAAEFLRTTTLSIKEITTAVGYRYESDLDHAFKSTYGVTPKEYRRLARTRETQIPAWSKMKGKNFTVRATRSKE